MTEPYFWRYREQRDDMDDLDMLLVPWEDSGLPTDNAEYTGEVTIVWWDA